MKLKRTKTRELVYKELKKSQLPLSAAQLFSNLENASLTLSSIYRTLNAYLKNNIILKQTDSNGVSLYSLNKEEHKHFLICKTCESKITLDYCPYHLINEELKTKHGFEIDEHNVVLYGTCKNCTD